MIKEIFFYVFAIIIFLYIKDAYQINIYSQILFYIVFIGLIFILERKFFRNDKFFIVFFIIQSLLLILFIKFQFKYLKNDKNNTNISIQQKSAFQTEEQKYKYNYGTIEEKIVILKNMGLSKQEVYNKLENNTDFRILIKDNQNKFDEIFQKK